MEPVRTVLDKATESFDEGCFQIIWNAAFESIFMIFNCLNAVVIGFCQFISNGFRVVHGFFQLFDSLLAFAGLLLNFNYFLVSKSIFLLQDICNYILDFLLQTGKSFLASIYQLLIFTLNLPFLTFEGVSWMVEHAALHTAFAWKRTADFLRTVLKAISNGLLSSFYKAWEGFVLIVSVAHDYIANLADTCCQFIIKSLDVVTQSVSYIWKLLNQFSSIISQIMTECLNYVIDYFSFIMSPFNVDNMLLVYSSFIGLLKNVVTLPYSVIITLLTYLWTLVTVVTGFLFSCLSSCLSFLKDHANEFVIGTLVMLFLILPYVFMDSSYFQKLQRFMRQVFSHRSENDTHLMHNEHDLDERNQIATDEELGEEIVHNEEQQPYDADDQNIDSYFKYEGTCVICHDNSKSVLLLPCRHLCLCTECTHQLLKLTFRRRVCPLCRSYIQNWIEVYV